MRDDFFSCKKHAYYSLNLCDGLDILIGDLSMLNIKSVDLVKNCKNVSCIISVINDIFYINTHDKTLTIT
jgi:hypothetical protein